MTVAPGPSWNCSSHKWTHRKQIGQEEGCAFPYSWLTGQALQEAAGSGPFAGKGSGLVECFLSVGAGMVQRPPLLQCPVLTMDKVHLLILEPVLGLL